MSEKGLLDTVKSNNLPPAFCMDNIVSDYEDSCRDSRLNKIESEIKQLKDEDSAQYVCKDDYKKLMGDFKELTQELKCHKQEKVPSCVVNNYQSSKCMVPSLDLSLTNTWDLDEENSDESWKNVVNSCEKRLDTEMVPADCNKDKDDKPEKECIDCKATESDGFEGVANSQTLCSKTPSTSSFTPKCSSSYKKSESAKTCKCACSEKEMNIPVLHKQSSAVESQSVKVVHCPNKYKSDQSFMNPEHKQAQKLCCKKEAPKSCSSSSQTIGQETKSSVCKSSNTLKNSNSVAATRFEEFSRENNLPMAEDSKFKNYMENMDKEINDIFCRATKVVGNQENKTCPSKPCSKNRGDIVYRKVFETDEILVLKKRADTEPRCSTANTCQITMVINTPNNVLFKEHC